MEEPTAAALLQQEALLFALMGLPVGAACWIWAEQLAEMFVQRSTPKDNPIVLSKRGKSPITGRASHWEAAVAEERGKSDAKVIRVVVAVLLGLWAVRLIWKLVAMVV
jgi:hypothetical protein